MPRNALTPIADTPLTVTSWPSTVMVADAVLFAFAKGLTRPPLSELSPVEVELSWV